MKIVSEDVDGDFYIDLVLDPQEVLELSNREMVEGIMYVKGRKWHLGLFQEGVWDHEDEDEVEGE